MLQQSDDCSPICPEAHFTARRQDGIPIPDPPRCRRRGNPPECSTHGPDSPPPTADATSLRRRPQEESTASAATASRCSRTSRSTCGPASSWPSSARAARARARCLHLLGTLDRPDEGEVWFAGGRIDNLSARRRDAFRNRQLGMIFQFYHLLPELTMLENVLAPVMITEGVVRYLPPPPAARAGRQATDRHGRPEPSPEAQAAAAFRRRDAAGGHRPGADQSAASAAGRRADRQPRHGDRPRHPGAAA